MDVTNRCGGKKSGCCFTDLPGMVVPAVVASYRNRLSSMVLSDDLPKGNDLPQVQGADNVLVRLQATGTVPVSATARQRPLSERVSGQVKKDSSQVVRMVLQASRGLHLLSFSMDGHRVLRPNKPRVRHGFRGSLALASLCRGTVRVGKGAIETV